MNLNLSNISLQEERKYIKFPFGPVIEPYASKQCIISNDPLQLCRKAWGDQIPTIFTVCADEGLISYKGKANNIQIYTFNFLPKSTIIYFPFIEAKNNPVFLKILNNEPERLVPLEVEKHCTSEKCKELGATLKKCYYGDTELSNASITTYTQVCYHLKDLHILNNNN